MTNLRSLEKKTNSDGRSMGTEHGVADRGREVQAFGSPGTCSASGPII